MINFEEFQKIELRVAKILSAEKVEGADKLIKLTVDLGGAPLETGAGERQIVAGIAQYYAPEALVGRQIVVVANLEPKVLRGLESQGMLLAAHGEEGEPILLTPEKEAPIGSIIS